MPWVKTFVLDSLDFLDSVAAVFGLTSTLDQLLDPIRSQLDDLTYDVMKQYSMQTIIQAKNR